MVEWNSGMTTPIDGQVSDDLHPIYDFRFARWEIESATCQFGPGKYKAKPSSRRLAFSTVRSLAYYIHSDI